MFEICEFKSTDGQNTTITINGSDFTNQTDSRHRLIEVNAACKDPGRPPQSVLSPLQSDYSENEQVVYTCNQFISLRQFRKCSKGKWEGDVPICGNLILFYLIGEALRKNDLALALIYKAKNGFPIKLLKEYNLTGQLKPFTKFGNSFIAERLSRPLRASNSDDYYWHLILEHPAMIQMVRISFSIVNHLTDVRLQKNEFDVVNVNTNQFRNCVRVANHSVSPWMFNSTRFDYWYFCRPKSEIDLANEVTKMTNIIRIETKSDTTIEYDLATLILAESYINENNYSDPICGLPEVPFGMEARVINDQTRYAFSCSKNFERADNFGGDHHIIRCSFDNRWSGQLPNCRPTQKCSKFSLENEKNDDRNVEVYKYDRVFYLNETEWIPITGTQAFFRCKDETNIFVGKDIRVCENGEWTNGLHSCIPSAMFSFTLEGDPLRTRTILIIVFTVSTIMILLSGLTFYFFIKIRNSKQHQQEINPGIISSGMELDNFYCSPNKMLEEEGEMYETIKPRDVRYTPFNVDQYDYCYQNDLPQTDNYYDDSNVRPKSMQQAYLEMFKS
ncbi:hypothetical protein QR98_0015600 [Sarcoptes scabiei]|uniref:Sushi domain-containing protein n=1 Tax=Sarcoptes scabiei TaxID=52283 RepID=A0A131ZYE1_SARSC|nr:hypothetical protein QR98_0015600 [Sarcoptes scabiei]